MDRSTDVLPVRAHNRETHQAATEKERHDDRDVVQVGAALIGVVMQEHVIRMYVLAVLTDDLLRRPQQREDVLRIVFGLHDEFALGAQDGARQVIELADSC